MDPFSLLSLIIGSAVSAISGAASADAQAAAAKKAQPDIKPPKPQVSVPEHQRLSSSGGGGMPADTGSSVAGQQSPNDVRLSAIDAMKKKLGV